MAQLTTIQQIAICAVSQYLTAEDVSKGGLFPTKIASSTPVINYMDRAAVNYFYTLDRTNDTLTLTGNYMYSHCLKNARAQYIINNAGGGGISPVVPSSPPSEIQFEVAVSGTFMVDGDVSKQFPDSWKGFNLLFFRGTIPQRTNVPSLGTYYTWDRPNAILTLLATAGATAAAITDEEFQFFPI